MVTDIVLDPLLPLWSIAAFAALTTALLALAIWRGLAGWALRAGAALVLLFALANPAFRQENRTPLADIVLLVIDRSSSQKIADRPAQIADARAKIEAKLGAISNLKIKTIVVKDAPVGTDAGTLLMTALSDTTAEIPRARLAGAILITDGQVHDMTLAPDFPAPVQTLLTGKKTDWDRRLKIINAPAFAIMGESVTLKLMVEDQGNIPASLPQTSMLTIAIDGGARQTFNVEVGQELTLPIKLAHGGQNVLQFKIPTIKGELTARNNAAVVTINGVRDRLRVLLVSGEPHAGERTWRNLLKSDSSVDLVHFTILRPPGKQDGVPVSELSLIAFPTRELFLDKIDQFDLIIFDRYRRRGILPSIYLDNVARYVEGGGAVLVAAGPAFAGAESLYRSPLARILPASPTAGMFETGFVPKISKLGERHPVTAGLENFAPRPRAKNGDPGWGRWFRMVDLDKRSGDTVMTGPKGRPLLILDRVGKGRVALLASDQAWLWSRGFEGGGPQLELLRRLAHWMMKEPELEEESLSASAKGRDVTVIRRSLREKARILSVTNPDGKVTKQPLNEVAPGRYVAKFTGDQDGLYRLREGKKTAVIALGPAAPKEFENAISTGNLLAPLARATRGGVLRLAAGVPDIRFVREGRVAAGRGWIGLTRRNAYVTTDIRLRPIGSELIFLLLAAFTMLGAWWREGR
ncbi:MAG: hypothetical protein GXP05_00675 [Alphaproteobacteria bacterium]|nr:hypothetical protein [Alphaproteobacteria bacterium]